MMSIKQKLTGKPSIDRPWMQYYPQEMIENLTVPNSTLYEYLMYNCPGDDVVAIHYYGRDITWKQIKEETDKVARALKAVGFGENDEIPMFLRSVPEFISLLLVAEKIGASLICRDNKIEEIREKLNRYAAELFVKVEPLGKSIYEVNGILANLNEYTDVIFSIKNIDKADWSQYSRYIYVLSEFINSIGKMSEDYTANPWHGAIVQNVSNELRHDIGATLPKLSDKIKKSLSINLDIKVSILRSGSCKS